MRRTYLGSGFAAEFAGCVRTEGLKNIRIRVDGDLVFLLTEREVCMEES